MSPFYSVELQDICHPVNRDLFMVWKTINTTFSKGIYVTMSLPLLGQSWVAIMITKYFQWLFVLLGSLKKMISQWFYQMENKAWSVNDQLSTAQGLNLKKIWPSSFHAATHFHFGNWKPKSYVLQLKKSSSQKNNNCSEPLTFQGFLWSQCVHRVLK